MGGVPPAPPVIPPPPPPIAETDPGVEAAKAKEITRLAARKSFKSTIRTQQTSTGQLAQDLDTKLLKTTLGS